MHNGERTARSPPPRGSPIVTLMLPAKPPAAVLGNIAVGATGAHRRRPSAKVEVLRTASARTGGSHGRKQGRERWEGNPWTRSHQKRIFSKYKGPVELVVINLTKMGYMENLCAGWAINEVIPFFVVATTSCVHWENAWAVRLPRSSECSRSAFLREIPAEG